MASSMSARRRHTATTIAALGLVVPVLALAPMQSTGAAATFLPLGDPELREARTTETLAPGVDLVRIVRGENEDEDDDDQAGDGGPWRVNVIKIDPRTATGKLIASHGTDLVHGEKTTDLAIGAGAIAGVNASFYGGDLPYPWNPVGLSISEGELLREPGTQQREVDFLVDAETGKVTMGRMGWTGHIWNRRLREQLELESLNSEPHVPRECAELVDQATCAVDGDTVRFTADFDVSTPVGLGVEVVLGPRGCVVRRLTIRGTALAPGETSIQATGQDASELLRATSRGCMATRLTLLNRRGKPVATPPTLYGVSGKHRLIAGGEILEVTRSGDFFDRQPRTIAGNTADGIIMLATIDGRQASSVGATLAETALVAQALGMHDAVNLDGGGSTTMAARGQLVNQPSSWSYGGQRPVADALVYVEPPTG